MKAIGVKLGATVVIPFAIALDEHNRVVNLTGGLKFFKLENESDSSQVISITKAIHSFFDEINPDVIGIFSRQALGKFRASPASFKMEGLLQIYEKTNIELIPPVTISAYYRKNPFEADIDDFLQADAAKLANYLVRRKVKSQTLGLMAQIGK